MKNDSREKSTTGHTKTEERMNGEIYQQIKEEQAIEMNIHLGFCPYTTNYRPLKKPLFIFIIYFTKKISMEIKK
jgi:hypothetical protein